MIDKEIFGYISSLLTIIGYVPYIFSILNKSIKPHVFSWIIWGTIAGIAFFAQDSDNAGPGAWAMGITAASCLLIAALAFRYGERHITHSDCLCFIIALLALPVWYITKNPLWALLLITGIDGFGYYPTFRKSWSAPNEENVIVYLVDSVKFLISLFALDNYSLITMLSPMFITATEAALVIMIISRRMYIARMKNNMADRGERYLL